VLSIRVDESLYFANARYLEDLVLNQVAGQSGVSAMSCCMCSAVNAIDMSALESLEAIAHRQLGDLGMRLHLSEVKGPVMDRLARALISFSTCRAACISASTRLYAPSSKAALAPALRLIMTQPVKRAWPSNRLGGK
jgi:MFS superfamily sulfate permease-like transporter